MRRVNLENQLLNLHHLKVILHVWVMINYFLFYFFEIILNSQSPHPSIYYLILKWCQATEIKHPGGKPRHLPPVSLIMRYTHRDTWAVLKWTNLLFTFCSYITKSFKAPWWTSVVIINHQFGTREGFSNFSISCLGAAYLKCFSYLF